MSYATKARKANEMFALARAGAVIWWRRDRFNQPDFREVEPKWHILTGRDIPEVNPEEGHKTDGIWLALCGYKRAFSEQMFEEFPNLKKLAPKKDTRCRTCVGELPAYKSQLAEMALTAEAAALDEDDTAAETQPGGESA